MSEITTATREQLVKLALTGMGEDAIRALLARLGIIRMSEEEKWARLGARVRGEL